MHVGTVILSRRPIAADAPGSGRSAPRSFAVARWGDASGIDPLSPGSETPAGRALSGRSLARSAWWAQVYAARGEPRMRQYDGWISKAGARRGGGAPSMGNQSGLREMESGCYNGRDMRPFIVQSSQGNFPKSTPSKWGMTQPLTHSHVLEPRKTSLNEFLKLIKGPPQYFKKGDSSQ